MFRVLQHVLGTRGLELVGVQLSVGKQHGVRRVLVVMRECVEAFCEVESEHHQGDRAHHLLLERQLVELGGLFEALLREQVVLVLIELLLYLATEHI